MTVRVIDNGTSGAAWIPSVWAQEILANLRANIVLAKLVNRDYDAAVSEYGKTINVPQPVILGTQTMPVDPTTTTNLSLSTLPVNLDQWITSEPVTVSDIASIQSRPDIMAQITTAASIAVCEKIESTLWATAAAAAYSVGTAGTDVVPVVLAKARQLLIQNKVPQLAQRYAVLSPKDYAAVLTSQNVSYALNYGGADAIREGKVPTLYGLEIHESQLVPSVAGTPVTTQNLVFARDYMTLVTRPLPLPEANVLAAIVTDSETGLAFRMTLGYDQYKGASVFKIDVLFGTAILRPEFGVQLKG